MMDNPNPLVSVIVPVFQVENTLEECLESIELQVYKNLEIILIDDGSTDGSASICLKHAEHDERIRVVTQANGGLASARNAGLDCARGDYLIFVDSDDCIASDHISFLCSLLEEEECDIAVTNLTPFTDVAPAGAFEASLLEYSGEEAVMELFYQGAFDTCAPAKLYRAALWKGIRFPVGYIHEDLPTVYKVLLKANKVIFAPGTTYGYRFNENGLNHSKTTLAKTKTLRLVENVVDEMAQRSSDLTRAAECFYLSFCFHLLLNADDRSLPVDSRKRIASEIVKYRSRVLRDPRARKKTRAACLLSYAGMGFVGRMFRIMQGVL